MSTDVSKPTTHAPSPVQVHESRDKKISGDRLPANRHGTRPYYCRTCGVQVMGVMVPQGWYVLTRAAGTMSDRPIRLGLYCSIDCLEAQVPRLAGIDDDLGAGFNDAPSKFRQLREPGYRR